MQAVFLGIDLGTSGMRVVALSEQGEVVGKAERSWDPPETNPGRWLRTLKALLGQLKTELGQAYGIVALSACSTSGTVLAVDGRGIPMESAWLYSDKRGQAQAQQLGIPSSWGLSRWLWWAESYPERYQESYLAHPADFLLSQLGGRKQVTDHTHALKSGFDLESYSWPKEWLSQQGLNPKRFPEVVAPGTVLGTVGSEWGLGQEVLITAGMTDGCAGQLAAGASQIGQVSTSLGTTLIFKANSTEIIQTQSLYSHLHPDKTCWWPGAASFCGGGILPRYFPGGHFQTLDQQAQAYIPTGLISYPLVQPGERFPIVDPSFAGFLPAAEQGSPRFYAALLEGVAMVERLGLETLSAQGIPVQEPIWTTGGGSKSPLWLSIRASMLNRPLALVKHPEPAVGAAILAASAHWCCSVQQAAERLVQVKRYIQPQAAWVDPYAEAYQAFQTRLSN
ncbi:FGGY-family carbohydrate kinase [Thermostichus vulcanus]|uniref:FGGY-family carbohydrate kinase n=1 Tax=Thermostichus vulcanus str. 'Rupite' TaxID=2813851 RepID=A0ABT0C736_THEVL|nr:FGGY-family carbohydrate kinase [Thermostichus vulcanus]MCJ2541613.1 FGGY-family carbohydrate kinase [Thermostichus vulcanus str. 'Rupite']